MSMNLYLHETTTKKFIWQSKSENAQAYKTLAFMFCFVILLHAAVG